METPRVRDLFKIPDHVAKMAFTVVLAEGVEKPQETVGTYVVTPDILAAYRTALNLIGAAFTDRKSQASYLHGSFGSGKSHFMAMLSLLLRGDEVAWSHPDLAPLRANYAWVGQRKVLELHLHMLNKDSLEEAIFAAYIKHVLEHHPDAPIPALFADDKLFDNAAALRAKIGDDEFFAPLNALAPAAADAPKRWGQVKARAAWDGARFDAARTAVDPDERRKLLDALVRTHFSAFVDTRRFRDLDEGLVELTEHAKALGYDAVILFLDELILWLSMIASSTDTRLSEWIGKMVKLVESDKVRRALPVVSFIARQRDLSEMVGEQLAGPDLARLREILYHARGRFGEIVLGDNNLPAIVEKRVLQPRDAGAVTAIDTTFARLERAIQQTPGTTWATLLGSGHDRDAFRKLYPFSPVLVDALVYLSNTLQRQRTAIRLLTDVLMEHIEDLKLGQLIGIGDLFDVLAGGDETPDGPLQHRLHAARELYRRDVFPLLRAINETDSPEKCQRLRPGFPNRIGCSNCPMERCRTDNRIIKTLIIAALIPGLPAFKDLRASRLVALNFGHVRALFPGQEPKDVISRMRKWQLPQLYIGDEKDDPSVALQLENLDVRPIIAKAREAVGHPQRVQVLCAMLTEELNIPGDLREGVDYKHDWRNTVRPGLVRFTNVRRATPDDLRCPEGQDWRILIDYPIDEQNFGPADDVRVIDNFLERQSSWTLVWLPHFLSESSIRLLDEYIAIDRILTRRGEYLHHLSIEHQGIAEDLLRNLKVQKRSQVLAVLAKAYGLARLDADDRDLDPSRRVDSHRFLLRSGEKLRAPLAASRMAEAIRQYMTALLEQRYRDHPDFGVKVGRNAGKMAIESALRHFTTLVQSDERRLELSRDELQTVRDVLGALGLVTATEQAIVIREQAFDQIEQRRQRAGVETPSAEEVYRFFDPDGFIGLQDEARAIVVRAYAVRTARAMVDNNRPYEPTPGQGIPGRVLLEKPPMPDQVVWTAALRRLGAFFGQSFAHKFLNPDSLRRFAEALTAKLGSPAATAASELPNLLETWLEVFELPRDGARLKAATAMRRLLLELKGRPAVDQVNTLANFEWDGDERELGASFASAERTVEVLRDVARRTLFTQLRAHRGRQDADAILASVAELLTRGETSDRSLARRMPDLVDRVTRIVLANPADTSREEPHEGETQVRIDVPTFVDLPLAPGDTTIFTRRAQITRGRQEAEGLLEALRAALAELPEDVSLSWTVDIRRSK